MDSEELSMLLFDEKMRTLLTTIIEELISATDGVERDHLIEIKDKIVDVDTFEDELIDQMNMITIYLKEKAKTM